MKIKKPSTSPNPDIIDVYECTATVDQMNAVIKKVTGVEKMEPGEWYKVSRRAAKK